MIHANRQRLQIWFAALAALAVAGAALALLWSPVAAQEGYPVPAKPTGLAAQASHNRIVLAWDDPSDDGVTGYVILRRIRGVDEEGQFSTLVGDTETAATTYTDDSVAAETSYIYRVQAINAAGASPRSDWVRADTPAPPIPAQPTGLAAAAVHNAVILTWNDSQDDTITSYVILRRNRDIQEEGQFSTLVADTETAATTHTDHTVQSETPYTYRIKAINAGGMSERSRWVHTETPAAPAAAQQSPDADDFPASAATTAQLTVGPTVQSVAGTIETDGDVDWVLIQAQHGQWYTLSVAGDAGDGRSPVATPYQQEYYRLDGELQVPEYALNKGAPHCTEGCSHVMVSRGGPRYVAVAARNGDTGSYRVTVTLERRHEGTEGGGSDMGAHTGTQGFLDMLTTGEFPGFNPAWNRLFGSITAGDADWYRIEMAAGQGYYFRLRDQQSDLRLRLRDADGNVLSTVPSWRYMRAMACAEGAHYLEVYRPDGAATHTTGYVVEAELTPGLGMRPLRGALLNTGQVQLDWQCYGIADSHQVQFRLDGAWTTLAPGDGNPAGITMSRLNDGFTAKMAGLPATDDYPEYRFRIRPVVNGAAMIDHRTLSIVVIPDAPGNLRGGWSYQLYPDALTMEWDKVEGDNVDYEVQIRDHRDQQWVDLGLDPPPGVIYQQDPQTRIRILAASPRYVALVSPHGYAAEHVLMRVRATQYGKASPWTRPFEVLFADQAWVGVGSLAGALSQAGQATLSWSSPTYIGEGSFNLATTYVLYRRDGEWVHLLPGHDVNGVTIAVSSGGAVVSGLPAGLAEYQFSVRHFGSNRHDYASSTLLLSPWSRTLTITTGLQRPGRPEATQSASGQVSLTWDAVEQAARYRLRLWMEDRWVELDGDHGTGVSVAMSGTTAVVSGLPDDYYWYIFEVKALGQYGVQQSGWSPNVAVFNQRRSGGQ